MIDFSEYCEIADFLSKIYNLEENQDLCHQKAVFPPQLLMVCAAASDIEEDDAYFEALMKKADFV